MTKLEKWKNINEYYWAPNHVFLKVTATDKLFKWLLVKHTIFISCTSFPVGKNIFVYVFLLHKNKAYIFFCIFFFSHWFIRWWVNMIWVQKNRLLCRPLHIPKLPCLVSFSNETAWCNRRPAKLKCRAAAMGGNFTLKQYEIYKCWATLNLNNLKYLSA